MDNVIKMYRGANCWFALHVGPKAEEVRRAMGTDMVPTAFTEKADGLFVRAQIAKLNPDYQVVLAS